MYRKNDFYTRLAKEAGYPACSAFKLQEIQNRFKIIKTQDTALDIGAFPGSFSMYLLSLIRGRGKVIGVDTQQLVLPHNYGDKFHFIHGSIFTDDVLRSIQKNGPYSLIVSDAAAPTSGNRFVDASRSGDLADRVLEIARVSLKKHGNLIVKIFQGADEKDFFNKLKSLFSAVKGFKPKASHSESIELYYIARHARFGMD